MAALTPVSIVLLSCAGVGLLYRHTLLEAFPGVEDGMRSLGDRLRGRQRSSLYQVWLHDLYQALCNLFLPHSLMQSSSEWLRCCMEVSAQHSVLTIGDGQASMPFGAA